MTKFKGFEVWGAAALLATCLSIGCGTGGGKTASKGGTSFGAGGTHSVDLNWNASTPVASGGTITGYNVYRSSTPNTNFQLLNPTPLTGLAFNDPNVVAGHTYYYVVTSIDSNMIESAFSNQATAVIPSP